MRYAVATEMEDVRAFYQGGDITIAPLASGGMSVAVDLITTSAAAHCFGLREAAAQFADNMTTLCGVLPGHERTWFVVELPEPRP